MIVFRPILISLHWSFGMVGHSKKEGWVCAMLCWFVLCWFVLYLLICAIFVLICAILSTEILRSILAAYILRSILAAYILRSTGIVCATGLWYWSWMWWLAELECVGLYLLLILCAGLYLLLISWMCYWNTAYTILYTGICILCWSVLIIHEGENILREGKD